MALLARCAHRPRLHWHVGAVHRRARRVEGPPHRRSRCTSTLARRWAKAMGVLFAVGAVSGTILSFEFGILWPRWMGRFGDVMGLPFAIEGFAFFLEAIFIGIYLYGWDRLPPRIHLWAGVPIGVAGVASAFFVVAANGWMNDPTGFQPRRAGQRHPRRPVGRPVQLRAVARGDPHDPRRVHRRRVPRSRCRTRGRCCAVAGPRYERVGLLLPLTVAMLAVPLQIVAGDWAARHVAQHQPAKLAAMEGLYATTKGAPLHIGGIYIGHEVVGGIRDSRTGCRSSPSTIRTRRARASMTVAAADRPPVNVVRTAFQLMVDDRHRDARARARGCCSRGANGGTSPGRVGSSGPRCSQVRHPIVALECGWITTEVGRQPWIVWQVMRVQRRGHPRAEHPVRLFPARCGLRVHGGVHRDRAAPPDAHPASGRAGRVARAGRSAVKLADACAAVMFVGIALYALLAGADFGAGFWDLAAGGDERGARTSGPDRGVTRPGLGGESRLAVFVLVMLWTAFPVRVRADHVDAVRATHPRRGRHHLARLGLRIPQVFRDPSTPSVVRRDVRVVVSADTLHAGCGRGWDRVGRVPVGDYSGGALSSWLNPTSMLGGVMAVVVCAFLASVYLTADAERRDHADLVAYFRRRAIASAIVAGIVAARGCVRVAPRRARACSTV